MRKPLGRTIREHLKSTARSFLATRRASAILLEEQKAKGATGSLRTFLRKRADFARQKSLRSPEPKIRYVPSAEESEAISTLSQLFEKKDGGEVDLTMTPNELTFQCHAFDALGYKPYRWVEGNKFEEIDLSTVHKSFKGKRMLVTWAKSPPTSRY